jgi:hypothetical protein
MITARAGRGRLGCAKSDFLSIERKERFLVADFPMEQTVLAGSRIKLECL